MSAEERQSEVVGLGELVDKGFATHELPVIDIIEAVAAAKDFMGRIGDNLSSIYAWKKLSMVRMRMCGSSRSATIG